MRSGRGRGRGRGGISKAGFSGASGALSLARAYAPSQSNGVFAPGLTHTRDSKVTYKRKRITRKGRRRARRSRNAFMQNLRRQAASQTLIRKNAIGYTATSYNTQIVTALTLLGNGYQGLTGDNDVNSLYNTIIGTGFNTEQKIHVNRGLCNFTITNTGPIGLIIKIFSVIPKTDVSATSTNQEFRDYYIGSFASTVHNPANSYANVEAQTRGTTPFQAPDFCANFTILSGREYHLDSSESLSTKFSCRGNKTLMKSRITEPYLRGLTTGVIIIAMPTKIADTGDVHSIQIEFTKTFTGFSLDPKNTYVNVDEINP